MRYAIDKDLVEPEGAMRRDIDAGSEIEGGEGNGYGAGGRFVLPGPTGQWGAPGSYGWGGHASTLFTVDPARRQIMVFMTQRMPSDKSPAPRELPAAIAADLSMRGA